MRRLKEFRRELEISDAEKWAHDTWGDEDIEIVTGEKIALRMFDEHMEGAPTENDLINKLCNLPKYVSADGQEYVQLYDVLETIKQEGL